MNIFPIEHCISDFLSSASEPPGDKQHHDAPGCNNPPRTRLFTSLNNFIILGSFPFVVFSSPSRTYAVSSAVPTSPFLFRNVHARIIIIIIIIIIINSDNNNNDDDENQTSITSRKRPSTPRQHINSQTPSTATPSPPPPRPHP